MLKILVKDKNIILGEKIMEAHSFYDRAKGLMFQNESKNFDGMMINPCNSIHTFFMKIIIHVFFVDRSNRIIKIYKNLRPWRITPIFLDSKKVIEIPSSRNISSVQKGDIVEILCLS